MNRRVRISIAVAILGCGFALLVGQGLKGTMIYSLTVDEVVGRNHKDPVDGLRVEGRIVSGSIVQRPADNFLKFEMTDGKSTLPVIYRGIVPDTFGDMGEVTVEGRYLPDGGFVADFLMAKCPSKYEMDPEALENRGGDHPPAPESR
ncbi:MAG: cytochrome c maturation protein CcmE [Candidatus Eisenbacteria bacterium]|uniref:Cytochrome c maturation protein CcmE n=1 Tax=Eiseniibacteriota bacterium TaxID=2212470 RepID=A0A948WB34_UNCEI|nr:cytochrome c maturation protein CcmE [Candidatus Eisenbacteria bacterium]MBU1950151.1 cytochrome c maturation protein CcmE [Candidatus Eisenbacteria bacterium]MBU2689603.1 cytochrome c maturation protein CcmE [Candidatus Eisenbacteria bacterium]